MSISERDFAFMQEVLSSFDAEDSPEGGSIRAVAQKFGITRTKVRKILITLGALSSPLPDEAVFLRDAGLTLRQIADQLGLALSTVSMYMPYATVMYKGEEQSANALRIKNFRRKLETISQKQLGNVGKRNGVKPTAIFFTPVLQESDKRSTGTLKQQETNMEFEKEEWQVFNLHLELNLEGLEQEGWDILRKHGDVKKGISRDILVPAQMTLHALHYVIMQSFGWLNGHLHHFALEEKEMRELTSENLRKFLDLVGLYFRFPVSDNNDIYWDDNYSGDKSFRSWLREKYTAPYNYKGTSEHFMPARMAALEFISQHRSLRVSPSFQDWLAAGQPKDDNMSSIKLLDEVSLDEASRVFDEPVGQLLERLPLMEVLGCSKQWREEAAACQKEAMIRYERNLPRLEELLQDMRDAAWLKAHPRAKSFNGKPVMPGDWQVAEVVAKHSLHNEMRQMNPQAVPIAKRLRYEYDYGDGWEVTVSCEEIFSQEGGSKLSPEMSKQVHRVRKTGKPLCINMDGKRLLDDVGGVSGYCNFLETINGKDAAAKREMKEWAKGLDWSGRRCSPNNLL